MATARDYAEWIVANKDKKGTPEFEKVSQAYALAKAKGAITAPLGPDSQAANIVRATGSGVADIVGWPIDMGTKALQAVTPDGAVGDFQFGGSDYLREVGADLGLTYRREEEPDTFTTRLFREGGSALVPFLGVGARGARLAGREATNAFDRMAQEAARRPVRAASTEAASVAAATVGGAIAEQHTDNPAIIALSELAGGLTPGAVAAVPGAVASTVKKMPVAGGVVRATVPFTETGGRLVAGKRVQDLAADAGESVARLSGYDTLPGVTLSPARLTGDRNLLALEEEILKQDPKLAARFSEDLARANDQTRAHAQEFLGDPQRTRKLLEQRREHVLGLLDTRAAQASQAAEAAVARLGPDATERQISMAVRGELEKALKSARAQERQLWEAVDRSKQASLENTREAFGRVLAERTEAADPGDIPSYMGLIQRKDGVTVGYLQDLRSRLLKDAAKARADLDLNRARILNNLASATLDDLAPVDDAIGAAADFSRRLNDKFTRGAVGQVLGHADDRGLRFDPAQTLEFMDQGKDIGRQNRLTQLLEAAPDAAPGVQNYLAASFIRQATDNGVVNPKAAGRFMEKYGDVLGRFPELRRNIDTAVQRASRAQALQGRAKTVSQALGSQKMSRASLYLDGTVGEEWRRVLNAPDPVRESRALLSQVRRDKDAVQGLKQGFVDELMRRAETQAVDEGGNIIVSGQRFRRMLAEHKQVADALLLPEERIRLNRIANTFARIDAKPGAPVPILDDKLSTALDFLASYLGARQGGRMAEQMGASLVLAGRGASIYRNLAEKLTTNKARKLLMGAVDDRELYRALLVGPTSSAKKQAAAMDKINAWLASPITQDWNGEQEPAP